MEKLRKIQLPEWTDYAAVFVIAVVGFCYIYSVHVINPTYTDWLLKDVHYDLPQHYLGWRAYRNGDWTFPIGYTDYLLYPTRTSVIFTDSIPCFAVLFKLLSPILPSEFQYFGLWGIMCFILQGVLSARIIRRFTDSKAFVILASMFFIFSPCMIRKMYGHTALAGQWIILLALQTVFLFRDYEQGRKIYIWWAVIGILTASVHIYFIPMCGAILLGYCVADCMAYKRFKRSFLVLVTYLFSAGFIIFLLGGSGVEDITLVSGGFSGINLNGLFNPQGYSCIFQDLPQYGGEQYEGFAYLGAGGILLLLFCGTLLITNEKFKQIIWNNRCEIAALAVIIVVSLILALSPVITINDRILVEYPLPDFIEKFWSIFRSTGRCGWILFYTLMLCLCIILCRIINIRTALTFLGLCVVIQVYDLHDQIVSRHVKYSQRVTYETVYDNEFSDFWRPVGESDTIKHIMFSTPITGKNLYAMVDWAMRNDKTVNTFYFARSYNNFEDNLEEALANPDETEIFLFPEYIEEEKQKCLQYDLNYYLVDDYIVGYTGTFENWEQLPEDYFQ